MLVHMCFCDSAPHKAFHHYPPITMDSRTNVLSLPVAPAESERDGQGGSTGGEVQAALYEDRQGDDDGYRFGLGGHRWDDE